MHPQFSQLTPRWFFRAFNYTGSIGDFRYRFIHADKKDDPMIHAAVYSIYCYEAAQDKVEQDFPWSEEGVEQLKAWLQEQYDSFPAKQA